MPRQSRYIAPAAATALAIVVVLLLHEHTIVATAVYKAGLVLIFRKNLQEEIEKGSSSLGGRWFSLPLIKCHKVNAGRLIGQDRYTTLIP